MDTYFEKSDKALVIETLQSSQGNPEDEESGQNMDIEDQNGKEIEGQNKRNEVNVEDDKIDTEITENMNAT